MRPSRYDHDDCLRVCREHKAELTAEDMLILIWVAGGWKAELPVTRMQLATARAIVSRMDAKRLSHADQAKPCGAGTVTGGVVTSESPKSTYGEVQAHEVRTAHDPSRPASSVRNMLLREDEA